MFDAFDNSSGGRTAGKRFAGPFAVSLAIYALIGGGVVLFAGKGDQPASDDEIEVVLEKKPKVAAATPVAPPPPPVAIPKALQKKSSAPPAPRKGLSAPKEMPTQPPPEDDASKDKGALPGEGGGSYDGEEGGSGPAQDPEPKPAPTPAPPPPAPAPVAKPKKMEPIDLPEQATPPQPLPDNPQPEYPEDARKSGVEGLVILKIAISEKGKIRSIEVLKSDPTFDDAAIDAVKKWKYSPAMVDGSPIAVYRIVKIPFRLG